MSSFWVFGACVLVAVLPAVPADAAEKWNVLVVTGGHDFTEKPFLSLFEGYDDLSFTRVALKDDSEVFEDISAWSYDVVVLFNMTQGISEARKQNVLTLLDRGVGFVVLHHAIAAFNTWPEFWKIIGVRYYLEDVEENGVKHGRCTYEHDAEFTLHVEDPQHPILQGVKDFTIRDETYKGSTFEPDNHVLLTTGDVRSDKPVAWTRTHGKANLCFIQPGHGDSIFADPNYRRLVVQAIRWTAKRP